MPEVKLTGNIVGFQYNAEEPGEGNKRKEQASTKLSFRASLIDDRDTNVGDIAKMSRDFVNVTLTRHEGKGSEIKLVGKIKGIQYNAEEPGEDNKRKEQANVKVTFRAPVSGDKDKIIGEFAEMSRDLVNMSIVESQMKLDAGTKKKKDGK